SMVRKRSPVQARQVASLNSATCWFNNVSALFFYFMPRKSRKTVFILNKEKTTFSVNLRIL
ncbi:hypothetical protein, partial [Enterococcus faecium]|uniref:hypothetical protein n=1 Tax=Enterococcus faecium TaxID=1352 RepID=UPI001BB244AF